VSETLDLPLGESMARTASRILLPPVRISLRCMLPEPPPSVIATHGGGAEVDDERRVLSGVNMVGSRPFPTTTGA
jgi:hypothetical protein